MMELGEIDEATLKAVVEDGGTDNLIEYIDTLPSETDYEWELQLTRLIENVSKQVDDLEQIYKMKTFNTDHDPEFIRFAAFFAVCIYHRRQNNVSEFGLLLQNHDGFDHHPMYPHLQALHAYGMETVDSYQMAIDYAREAINRVGDNHPGITHSMALTIVKGLEEGKSDTLKSDNDDLLTEAENYIKISINQINYPRYFVTHGRILALRGKYDEGIQKIHKALDIEDESKDDYAIRVNTYRSHEFKMFLNKHTSELSEEQQEIREKQETLNEEIDSAIEELDTIRSKSETRLREIQTQTLQFLGFFATLLAVIVSSINITTSFPLPEAASLILVLTGGLLAAFGGFTIVLPIDDVERKSIALFAMGTVLSGIGMTIVLQL